MRRVIQIRIHISRTYDHSLGRFSFDSSYEIGVEPTLMALVLAEAFDLDIDDVQRFPVLNALGVEAIDIAEAYVMRISFD